MLAAVNPAGRGGVSMNVNGTSSSLTPMQDAGALSAIRRALGAEEQVIRVSDSNTRETYDVMLSRTTPYASPYNQKIEPVRQSSSTAHRRRRGPRWMRSAWATYESDTNKEDIAGPHTAGELNADRSSEPFSPNLGKLHNDDTTFEMRRTFSERPSRRDPDSSLERDEIPRKPLSPTPLQQDSEIRHAQYDWSTPAPSPSQLAPIPSRIGSPHAAPALSINASSLGAPLEPQSRTYVPSSLSQNVDASNDHSSELAQPGHATPLGIFLDASSKPDRASTQSINSEAHERMNEDSQIPNSSAQTMSRPMSDARLPASENHPSMSGTVSHTSISSTGATEVPTFDQEMAQNADMLRQSRRAKEQTVQQQRVSLPHAIGRPVTSPTSPRTPRSARFSFSNHHSQSGEQNETHALVGNLIGEEHVNYVLMYHMLTGIRIGVSRCETRPRRPLTASDFNAKYKFTFDIVGNELSPSSNYDFKFKDYAPAVFRDLRYHFHLDTADYLLSLTAKYILSELGSPGKSGSFFYFSRDYRFIIKTIRHNEQKFLMKILPAYYEHVQANPHTLLSQFYGLHRVKLQGGRKIHFVIMNNLFPAHRDIHEMYDLKGSLVKREQTSSKSHAVLKDMNWVKRGRFLDLGPEKCSIFAQQLRRDVELLQRLKIMDYSMLIGIHDLRIGNHDELRHSLQVFQPETDAQEESGAAPISADPALRRPSIVVQNPEDQTIVSAANFTHPSPIGGKDKCNASALRSALRSADPTSLSAQAVTKLPNRMAEKRHYYFYADEGGFRSTDDHNRPTNIIYYLGVIDLFTQYDVMKRCEHVWKSLFYSPNLISPVAPKQYGERFIRFLLARPDQEKHIASRK
ncbi:1-phosphatidylinositol-4-phosphate 5-kinase [Malassezia yamatoensis]|uniref:1-phosphatidylinositol-4-phosphate 5-kinase n=1 Tax=Malassezia yamatoensis TaxID=253288 RepID=A0AAJ5YRA9_9BASI|nr:1-phosphatidylinositol-4-phosphate 5-kinase [Malassezia yamatoensis]